MAVTNNFASSTLDLNGQVSLSQPTALVWGADGRLYVTEVDGDVKVLTVAFGDVDPTDDDPTASFYVTDSLTLSQVKSIPNFNDDGTSSGQSNRQVTGIDVTAQYDDAGEQVFIDGKPAVTMYVTSSDSRIGAGGSGNDADLDTNSGTITKLTQTGPDSWEAVDIVRGLARSEENHALNGLEVIQEFDAEGLLVSERLIVANGGNANSGAPSNNFAGQQEQPYSGAILEIDLDAIGEMDVLTDPDSGRSYVYDIPTLDDPTRAGTDDAGDPHGGNDGLNSAKITADSPVQIYSPGYRNAYDVEVTDDGRIFTYDNGANNSWGGRPVGEAGSTGTVDFAQALGYIATNLNNGEGNSNDDINLEAWNPSNKDNFHEVTRSDDLDGRELSQGAGGEQVYQNDAGLTVVYGGHPNPTRAEGSRAGILFSPEDGTDNAFLLVSNQDSYGNGGGSDYDEVIAWLTEVEDNDTDFPTTGIYGADTGELTKKVIAVTPGIAYDIYVQADGSALIVETGGVSPGGTLIGTAGLPSDIAEIVVSPNAIEGDYLEAGQHDGALDTGNGSINGLTEYTSTLLDDEANGIKMSGAIFAASLNQGNLIIMGRNEDGQVESEMNGGYAVASDRTTLDAGGGPLGLAALGDDVNTMGLTTPFQGSVWAATYNQNGPLIEIFQPANGTVALAGSDIVDPLDNDLDGVGDIVDPFEYSIENGYALEAGQTLTLDFNPQNTNFPTSLAGTGLLGAALDGVTPNQDAQTADENFSIDQQQDGLYDIGGNVLPGGNAPILQIKNVQDGSVVGSANAARDVLHTGIRPSDDVHRIVATMNLKNWIPAMGGTEQDGQLAGLIYSDGTQSNFVRAVFGSVNGAPGIEVGYEIGDANYVTLAQIAVPELANVSVETLDLRLEIDMDDGFAVSVSYRLLGDTDFTDVPLNDGTPGFSLPSGVLQDVLTGDYTIGTGANELNSGAAIGFLAEDTGGDDEDDAGFNGLLAIDFNNLDIEAFGNEIAATTAAEVGQVGTDGLDTVIYTGTDTALAPLDATVENFDGSGSAADFDIIGNANDNILVVGAGDNTITTGAGEDTIVGTMATLSQDEITDFALADRVLITDATVADANGVVYSAGSAIITMGDMAITFSGPDFENFDPLTGPGMFQFTETDGGLELRLVAPETVLYRVNAGSDKGPAGTQGTIAAIDGGPDWIGDADLVDGSGAVRVTGNTANTYTNGGTDAETEIDSGNVDLDEVPWQVFANERSDNTAADPKLTYEFDVEAGTSYTITLFYTENWNGIYGFADANGGQTRQFDVSVEGEVPTEFQNLNPAQEAADLLGYGTVTNTMTAAQKAAINGTTFQREFTYEATDDTLTLEFLHEFENPKVNAIQITQLGYVAPPVDETAPVIEEIYVDNPLSVQDGDRFATVVLSDDVGFDAADFTALDGSELMFSGIVPDTVSSPEVVFSAGGTIATLTYTLSRDDNSWPAGEGQVTVAAGAYSDAAANVSTETSGAFVLEPNLGNLVRGTVVRAINVGTTDLTAAANLGTDLVGGGTDNDRYGGAIAADTLITDVAGNAIAFEADSGTYYTSPKTNAQLNANVDGQSGSTGSNSGGVDLDGSAYHTYRDSNADTWTATYDGFANGTYVVELHFAELYQTSAGTRVGDFYIQGESVEVGFDAFADAGGADAPTFFRHNVTVTDGTITIDVDSSAGQAGYSAIVVYDAIPSDLPPTISVADVTVAEGSDAVVAFTRIGDLTEEVEVTFTVTLDSASSADFVAPTEFTVTIPADQATASITIPTIDDDEEEAAETFTVSITGVSNTSGDAVADAANSDATVTIEANDIGTDLPAGGEIFGLEFETAGSGSAATGFSTLLGGAAALEDAKVSVVDGKLVITTSDGDLSQPAQTASKNDLVQTVDISDAALQEVFISTRFDNPFTAEEFTRLGITGEVIPNYLQQGIIIATDDAATNQDSGQFTKLIFGGGSGNGVQMWSQLPVNQQISLTAISDAAAAPFTLFDVASVELALVVDKVAGTIAQFVTLFDDSGEVLGGVRPDATDGFATAPAQALPPAVLAAINAGTSVVGVTSTDYDAGAGVDSFDATWDYVRVTSPQVEIVEGTDAADGVVYGDFSNDGLDPTDIPALENGDNVITASQQGDAADGGRDRDYFTIEVPEGQVLSSIILDGYAVTGGTDTNGFIGIQVGDTVTTNPTTYENVGDLLGGLIYGDGLVGNDILAELAAGGNQQGVDFSGFELPLEAGTYTIWLNQGGDFPSTATLNFQLTDAPADVTVSVASPADVTEAGDFGSTDVSFDLTATDNFAGDLTITYDTADLVGETALVSFVDGTGALVLSVNNDNTDNGAEALSVTLTGAVDAGGALDVDVDATAATAQVLEDDAAGTGTYERGEVLYAINAGGPALTQDGIDFVAGTSGTDGAPFTGGAAFTDGNGGNGAQPAFDGTVYETEINDDGDFEFGAAISFPGIDPAGSYYVDLYFAEIYASVPGVRVFDVAIEGEAPAEGSVLDNFDPLAYNGGDINAPIIIELPDPITPGENGTIDLSFLASADRGKISAIVVREAVEVVAGETTLSISNISVEEGEGTADIVFARTGDLTDAMTVTFAVADGTAIAGTDYEPPLTNTIVIAAGEASATLPITLIDDETELSDVDFTVTITDAVSTGPVSLGNGVSTVTILDDDAIDPADIDGDGILNAADPFAYDGDNGLSNTLTLGGSYRQDFDVDTTDLFSEDGGFSGIMVNPAFSPTGSSEADPYGDRTTEATSFIEDGVLKIESSETDAYATGTGASNTLKDSYQSAADVSGVDHFVVESVVRGGFLGAIPLQYASFGITLGAGGTDDYIKFVISGFQATPRLQLSQENSLTGIKEENIILQNQTPEIIEEDIASVLFRFEVDKSGEVATLVGTAILYDDTDTEIATITTASREITGSLADAMDGANPLTGGEGGIAYGITLTDWSNGANNRFVGEWDYLELSAPDNAPVVATEITAQAIDEDAEFSFVVPAETFADDGGIENLVLTATLADDSPLPAWLSFDGTTFTGTPAQGDIGLISVKVLADDGTNPPAEATFDIDVANVNDVPTATAISVPSVLETAALVTIALLSDAAAADEDGDVLGVIDVAVTTAGGDPVAFDLVGQTVTIDPTQFADLLNDGDSVALTVNYTITDNLGGDLPNTATLLVGGVDGPFTWYPDADGDGYGVTDGATIVAYEQPDLYALESGDDDDADATIYPNAVELNDGKDNDQDGEIDEDNADPVADDESFTIQQGAPVDIAVSTLLMGDTDANEDALTVDSVTAGVGGTPVLDAVSGIVTFTPDPDFTGTASFTYTVVDGYGGEGSGMVTVNVENRIVVTDPATPPASTDGIDVVQFDGPGDLDLSDPDLEDLDLSENVNDGGTVVLNTGDNTVEAGLGQHTVNLGGGEDTVSGTASELDGDTFGGFGDDDAITVENGSGSTIVSRSIGSAIIGVDTDGDGLTDTTLTLSGEIDGQTVVLADDGTNVTLTLDAAAPDLNDLLETSAAAEVDLVAGEVDAEGVSGLTVFDANGDPVTFAQDGTSITIDPAQFATALAGGESLQVTIAYTVDFVGGGTAARSSTLMVGGVDGPFTFYRDADEDSFGDATDSVEGYEAPEGYVSDMTDADDADDTVFPDAPEINDGKDNDQDGEVDEDNLAPVLGEDGGSTAPGVVFAISRTELLGNDSDPDGDAISFVGVDNAVNGTVEFDHTLGTISFTPTAGFSGTASFDYSVTDEWGAVSTSTVVIDVSNEVGGVATELMVAQANTSAYTGQNSRFGSILVDEEAQSVTLSGNVWQKIELPDDAVITETSELWFTLTSPEIPEMLGIGLDNNSSFTDGNEALFQLGGTNGTLNQANQDFRTYDTAEETVTFQIPLADFAGSAFEYLVFMHDQDADPTTTSSVFSDIRIVEPAPFNSKPLAGEDEEVMESDAQLVIEASSLLVNDTDADGDEITVTAVANAINGEVSLENGLIIFTAADGYTGPASFEYTITDSAGQTSVSTVSINVLEPGAGDIVLPINFNDGPIASYGGQDASPGTGYEVTPEGDGLTLTGNVWKMTDFADGEYLVSEDTVLRFDLTVLNPTGEVVAIGLENDGNFRSGNQALFQIYGNQNFSTYANQDYQGLYGVVGEATSYEISLADFAGQSFASLAFINDDDSNATSSVQFANVELVEPLPGGGSGTAAPEIFGGTLPDQMLTEDVGFEIDLPFFDTDTPFENLTFTFVNKPDFVNLVDGVLVGLPENDDVGTYTIGITATDPEGNATTGVFELTVENTNDAPVLTGVFEDQSIIVNGEFILDLPVGLFTDVDEGTVLEYSADGLPDGVMIDTFTGQISGTPIESGIFTVTVTASDGAESAFTSFELDVASGPPREAVLIEAEEFSAFNEPAYEVDGFYKSFAAPASGQQVIRVNVDRAGSISTDLQSKGVVPGFYDVSIIHLDESDGVASVTASLDYGDGSPLVEIGSFLMDRTDLPGQGNGNQAGNLTEYTFESVDIPVGARLVLSGQAESGEVLRIDAVRFDPVDNAPPEFSSAADQVVAEGELQAASVVATDPEGVDVSYAITGGADAAAFAIDAETGVVSFIAPADFEEPGDADLDNVYDLVVTADDGNVVAEQEMTITVSDANDAPTPTELLVDATVGLNQPITLPGLATLFADQDAGAVLTLSATGLPAGVTIEDGVFTGSPTEEGVFTVEVTASDGIADPVVATFDLTVAFDYGAVSPDEDLDGDGTVNALDTDVDGDGVDNADDAFAYDADNGMTLASGETRSYDFDIDGTVFENGMTGFLPATANAGVFDEDTGAASVSGGLLSVDPVTTGDTGTTNTPEDDTVVGVKNGDFTATAVVLNPWAGDVANPAGYDQLGLVMGIDSADMIKLVFGQGAGVVEFQKQDADVGTKYGGASPTANVPLPDGVTLDNFATAEITFDVASTDATSATVTGSIEFRADDGTVVGALDLGDAAIGGALAAALADAETGVAVGFTHAIPSSSPGFVAQLDSLEITAPDDGVIIVEDEVVFRINAFGPTVAATDDGPDWTGDSEASPISYYDGIDNRGDTFGYSGDLGAIPDGVPVAVLDGLRSSDAEFSYDIPTSVLGNGQDYEVRLFVSELYTGSTAQEGGFRNFDASLEGVVPAAWNDIDPGALYGADVGVLSAQVTVTDGTLNIGFLQDTLQNPIINAIEIIKLGGEITPPPVTGDPTNALNAFDGETDLITDATYGAGAVGSAVLEVMTGQNNIESSNYGNNSFQVTNTGDKKIAAVFVDVTNALYQDVVFDPDGAGGDDAFKVWGINSDGSTGAYIGGGDGGYFLAGQDPLPNDTGTGIPSNGGYKGAIVKFDGSDGGFENGETVGFSGDMDPNSIAGLTKASVDGSAIDSWDVGGISGHEMIGSTFTVLFDDGTTAYGQLSSDGSASGSQALASEAGFTASAPTLTVNGVGAGSTGTYGVSQPTITVTGTPGDTVRVTLTKGFNPVTETSNGIAELVENRLERYDFKASNNFDSQSIDVVIGSDGTFDATGMFDYNNAVANNKADGTFPGDDVAQLGFVASVIDPANDNLSISPVTAPIYLENVGGPVTGAPSSEDVLEILAGETDLVTTASYAGGTTGAAVLEIMAGNGNIESSNYGANSFQVTNVGDKKISAVFLDARDAIYPDSVFDPDGQGGDNVAKPWAVNSDGGTGAYIGGGDGGYFLPGVDPLANTTGTGGPSNGGYKGAIVKFSATTDGGFTNGETVGFSGDMDPNSIAGLTKASVDGTAIDSWDVGGISGHELIGSSFTVLFDDGTTATGQLATDGSASGSVALASQDVTPAITPTLAVNGVNAGETGTYGGTQPTIQVTGTPGDTVRIMLSKGFNPVTEASNGIAELVEDRLDRYDFEVSNNFDTQFVDVVIGGDGTFDATGMFDYDDAVANNKADGTFDGDDVAQITFVASVIDTDNDNLPISNVTAPIVLTNDGGPVDGDPVITPTGYFEMNGSGNNTYFKIQIEDENGTGGTTPGGKWSYATAADEEGRQSGFQGDGYYLFGSNTSTGIDNAVGGSEMLEYTIYVPEEAVGTYNFSFIVSRDGEAASDQQNDIWLNFKHAEDSGTGDIEEFLASAGSNEAEPVTGGFVKVYGGPNNGTWGNAGTIDGLPGNFGASISIEEEGFYTIQVDGRSQGYHVDYFELYKGSNPGSGAANSDFVTDDPVTGGNELVYAIDASSDDWEAFGGAGSSDLEFGLNGSSPQSVGLRFDDITIPDGAVIEEAYIRFNSYETASSAASFVIEIEDTEAAATYSTGSTPDDRTYSVDDFVWSNVESWTEGDEHTTPDISDLIQSVIGSDGIDDGALGFRVTGSGGRAAHSFDSAEGDAPELVIVLQDDFLL
ncbi:MAG: malectin domain-containing carbohydrate-binding protein [Sedimentitalea sp.]|uniref:Ig-like domain-containing protein n=1 Tax=Sedimentitalea sp. TaxID=2048915 RepID=UPI003266B4FE